MAKFQSNEKEVIFYVIFRVIEQFEGKRTPTGVIRLLLGSYAKQTIQDAYLFKSTSLYGILQGVINMNDLKLLFNELETQEKISFNDNFVNLTSKGILHLSHLKERYEALFTKNQPKNLRILITKDNKKLFWYRLTLIIQTIANLMRGNQRFIPIVTDLNTQTWVKSFLIPYDPKKIKGLSDTFYNEINLLKSELNLLEQKILLYRLSGYHRTGLSWRQLSEETGLSVIEVKLRFNLLMYKLLILFTKNPKQYPYLTKISGIEINENRLSHSSRVTLSELRKGLAIQQIASKRNLTVGTIYDHLIEILLTTNYINVEKYIDNWKIELIKDLFISKHYKTLTEYKRQLPIEVSYNDIRLLLAYFTSLERI